MSAAADTGADTASPAPALPPALLLDDAAAQNVFKHLDVEDCLHGAALVCRQWRRQTKSQCAAWKEEFLGQETTLGALANWGLC